MVLNDRIYGRLKITTPLTVELIKSKTLQRLKRIAQFGVPDQYYHLKNYSRFEHSVGVMVLLNKLDAPDEEQMVGLLHDVSHSAFSHVIDWVLGSEKDENFQDLQHKNFIDSSEVPGILKKYGYNTDRVVSYKNFGLLEREIPDICADRLDYSLREFPETIAKNCFKNLTVKQGKIVFKNQKSAKVFAINYLKVQKNHWGGFEAVSRYRIFADILKKALAKKIIKFDDFWQDDRYMVDKLVSSEDKEINRILKILEKKSLEDLPKGDRIVHKKFRYVDPLYAEDGKLVRLSEVDEKFKKLLDKSRKENKKGIRIPVI